MKRSTERILTTHAGRLDGPKELLEITRMAGGRSDVDRDTIVPQIKAAVADVVHKQEQAGVDIISDGEVGKIGGITYFGPRVTGLAKKVPAPGQPMMMSQRTNEREEFKEFYDDLGMFRGGSPERWVCVGDMAYEGQAAIKSDTDIFKAALAGVKSEEQFMCALAPGWIEHGLWNEHYPNDEAFLFAIAEAMKPEYKAIVDAGFILQLDDPGLPDTYDMIVPAPSIEDYASSPRFAWMP